MNQIQVTDSYTRGIIERLQNTNIKGPSTAYVFDRQGNKIYYDTLTSAGVKEQGQEFKCWFTSKENALDAYEKELKEYIRIAQANKKGSDIIWRLFPEWTCQQIFEVDFIMIGGEKCYHTYWNIYSRLLVSKVNELNLEGA